VDERGVEAVSIFFVVSVVALVLLLLGARSRAALPARLIGLGVLLALVALWYGMLVGLPNRQGVPVPYGNPALAEGALKLAAVMILGGIVAGLLTHDAVPASPVPPEVPRNVPPSV
jgi:hypothetical protein